MNQELSRLANQAVNGLEDVWNAYDAHSSAVGPFVIPTVIAMCWILVRVIKFTKKHSPFRRAEFSDLAKTIIAQLDDVRNEIREGEPTCDTNGLRVMYVGNFRVYWERKPKNYSHGGARWDAYGRGDVHSHKK